MSDQLRKVQATYMILNFLWVSTLRRFYYYSDTHGIIFGLTAELLTCF